eukprot:5999424-Pleurochrysis_carterae.AAC.1
MPTSERRSDGHLLSSTMVGDMPAYKARQLLGAQVTGAFALDVLVLCCSSGMAASSGRSGARMRMS